MDRKEYRRRLGQRPNAVRMDELHQLLNLYGCELVTVRGSHHVYTWRATADSSFRTGGPRSWGFTCGER